MATQRGPKPGKEKVTHTPVPGIPDAPKHLDPVAKRHWREVTSLLHEAGLASKLDKDSLEVYCSLYSQYVEAKAKVKTDGAVIKTPNGFYQQSPWYLMATQCLKDMKSFMDRFGLSPKARTALAVKEQIEVDPKWEGFE